MPRINGTGKSLGDGGNGRRQNGIPQALEASLTLRETVKQALLAILMDENANAAAKASAGRTLLEYFGEQDQGLSGSGGKHGAELSISELDREIARLGG
jgi:hypothetical protein